jgi:hypothetical protein
MNGGGGLSSVSTRRGQRVAELAEQIHFDPNTLMPGAQHPLLNYTAMEYAATSTYSASKPSGGGGGGGYKWGDDDDDDDDDVLPPPNASGASTDFGLPAPPSRPSAMGQKKPSASWLLQKRGLA